MEPTTYTPDSTTTALAILFLIAVIAYAGWFFGRVHEAAVEYREEELEEAAYQWAARHNKLPEPEVQIMYVDLETGVVLPKHEV